ncbi:uncharacterized protein FPRO_15913 [Fusarium proliferatum ET1]|uniref:AAA+ ATPase domain-containing protein n=1 Tax=Fusarium proliferatum (strain ET1) TaxID=1227346 RepID=A0A1L7WAQ7_FUSPR|nr:uncharacterized protein FPRO_15913 [Fusarium proliferatum ET1]CZR49554.1 uncharacterized protein FPRO_15913 [Fusarium proliferatum ET1]
MAPESSNVSDQIPLLPASASTANHDEARGHATRSSIPVEGEKQLSHEAAVLSNTIQNLKQQIQELEHQCLLAAPNIEESPTAKEAARVSDEYKRMEAYLYQHRKEWEANIGPGPWDMNNLQVTDFHRRPGSLGPWWYHWEISQERKYERPDPFSPVYNHKGQKEEALNKSPDEFDYTIDFGARRESLRKYFEWEMDRLYLVEETDRRRRQKDKQKEEKVVQSGKDQKGDQSLSREPKLDHVDWYSFKRAPRADKNHDCVIHILTGEPVVDEDGLNRHWFGYSGRQESRPKTQRSDYVISPLPERIRIRSSILQSIFKTILDTPLGDAEIGTFVLLRPFKALTYCQKPLQDWCTALEEKFRPSTEHEVLGNDKESVAERPSHLSHHNEAVNKEERDQGHHGATGAGIPSPRDLDTSGSRTAEEAEITQGPRLSGKDDSEEGGQGDEKKQNDSDDLTKSIAALKHLRCLLDFLNSDFIAKQTYLLDPLSDKIVFSDLWHLFRPGDEVIGSDGKQAYRLIGVSSARHRVTSPQELWYNPYSMRRKSKEGGSQQRKREKAPFTIVCSYIDFDGKHIGPVVKIFNFRRFDGEKSITSLDVYPLRYYQAKPSNLMNSESGHGQSHTQQGDYRDFLIERGATFLDVATVKHKYYVGPTIDSLEQIESQVVIDFETAFSMDDKKQKLSKPDLQTLVGNSFKEEDDDDNNSSSDDDSCQGECCRDEPVFNDGFIDERQRSEYITSLLPQTGEMNNQPSVAVIPRPLKELTSGPTGKFTISDSELAIMSYRVFGFVLRNRRWAQLDVSYLSDVHSNDITELGDDEIDAGHKKQKQVTSFDNLVLEEGHKTIILSLIAQHFRDKKLASGQVDNLDIVKGKGKGLILLLHGAPGVGKTSTAEGVAELFRKPLFQITCGDLGTTASDVEIALERNFSLANKWDCVLLLDEADVFLAARTKQDFSRNGLVAVFLRVMEYYAGILFLTTNRVGDFDEAFTSRIHISLYYPELNRDKTVEVFKINLAMIQERFARRGRSIKIDDFRIGSFAQEHFQEHPKARWNGRQIRNACQTALALAEFEAQGNSHEAILNPDALVKLEVRHFELVRNAFLEFANYMNDVYGVDSARRAKESRLRAVWVDENDRVVGADASGPKNMDLFLASQPSSNRRQQVTQASTVQMQGHQQQQNLFEPGLHQHSPQPRSYQPQYRQEFSPQYQVYSGPNPGQGPEKQYPNVYGSSGTDIRVAQSHFQDSAEGYQNRGFSSQQLPVTTPALTSHVPHFSTQPSDDSRHTNYNQP